MAFGVRATIWGGVALLWPLVLSLIFGNLTATIVFYIVAMVLDVALFVMWLKRALDYSKRASRGEAFSLQAPVTDASTRGIPVKH